MLTARGFAARVAMYLQQIPVPCWTDGAAAPGPAERRERASPPPGNGAFLLAMLFPMSYNYDSIGPFIPIGPY